MHELLDKLNPMQRKAVELTDGPQLIIAGAGSGKTRVITHKIAYLIKEKHVPPWRIFAATFTNKAANEMKERVISLLKLPGEVKLNISTFHSLCAGFLRREAPKVGLSPHYTIVDERDQLAVIRDCLNGMEIPPEVCKPQQAQDLINMAKINLLNPEDLENEFYLSSVEEIIPEVFRRYQRKLAESDAADFEDLILHIVRLLKKDEETRRYYQERFQYILVDEYQDTNFLQFELIRLLAGAHDNLCVVGDEDQSIYSWRGAKLSNLLDFSKTFPGTQIIKLEQNYRSTKNILKAADAVIANNMERIGKTLWSERPAGDPIFVIAAMDETDEARRVVETILTLCHLENVPLGRMAIFYRQNSLSRTFEDEIRRRRVAYRIVGGIKFYDRAEVKDLLAYLKSAINPNNTIALQRIINTPARGIGNRTVEKLLEIGMEKTLTLFQSLEFAVAEKLLPAKASSKITEFLAQLKDWMRAASRITPFELLRRIIEETHYIESLGDPKSIEVISKKDNIQELQNAVQDFFERNPGSALEDYFETLALAAPVDELQNADDCLALMTLHAAKGLEFDAVFMVGMEDPIFPNRRTVEESQSIEEERRLFYVGLTRARNRVFLSRADSRLFHGKRDWNLPSLFIDEIPENLKKAWDPRRYGWNATDRHCKKH
ncbi:MAG TPA: UvrD-helicase domain-containing protein [Candidatus Sumerlaeota bacterium]|nr:MAG: ATP-dependent DNA helicase PcrA [candidate division BRC1 bacterium ADurb.Bin183]HON50594.1 UvrD-helicase domain-containing protein [Candidatus Sumerlaeota bacterium]HRR32047.1 UvrD-helicase domain-containing protein [Candidatus Sumerlaeia bacterium]HRU54206.1 UvrD-helicase domain-containing protein [Candidatus Sumerlaeia bacterium]